MSYKYFGETFDIHGGGQDLIFPHHENEIAQSTCAHGHGTFAKYWMHNGYLMVEGEKMSKSLGNFFTVKDLLEKAPGEAIRLCLMSTHYHQPLNWTDDGLRQAKQALDKFYTALTRVEDIDASGVDAAEEIKPIINALCDDLNAPAAIAVMHDLVGRLNKSEEPSDQAVLKAALLQGGNLLGLLQHSPEVWRKGNVEQAQGGLSDAEIESLIAARNAARKNRDFAEADRIRDLFADNKIVLEDGPSGTQWRRA
jgi:cysteinyl-tRNA synthetase